MIPASALWPAAPGRGIIALAGEPGDRPVPLRRGGEESPDSQGSVLSELLLAGQEHEGRSRPRHRPGTDSATENKPPSGSVR